MLRARFWSIFLKRMGKGSTIWSGCKILSPQNVEIGDYTFINENCILSGHANLKIGNFVMIGPNCLISTSDHRYSEYQKPMRLQGLILAPIIIEDDVWLGANVVILPGVRVKRGSIVGANSVVTKDVDAFTIVGGVPAKLIKGRFRESDIKNAYKVDLQRFKML